MRRDNNRFDYEDFSFNSYEYEPYGREVNYYRKIEKKTASGIGNGRYREYTSYTNNSLGRNDDNRRNSSFISSQRGLKQNRSFSNKQKYSFGGRIREKNNYVYYVSGIGYVNKNGENKQEKRQKNVIKIGQRPKPIVMQSNEGEKEEITELIDNYQYHETKEIKRKNKETTVTHLRLCEPFYHTRSSRSRKRYSSYTEMPRGNSQGSFMRREEEYEVVKPKKITNKSISSYNNNISVTSNGNKYKYFSSRAGSQSTKNYGTKYIENRTNSYKRRNVIERKKGIPSGYNSKHQNIKNIYQRKNEERKGKELTFNNSYNNIQRHEIKVVTEKNRNNKNINKGYEYNKQKPQLINLSYNNQRKKYNSRTKDINEEVKRKYDYKYGYGYGYDTSSVECDNVMYKQNMDYSPSEMHPTRVIYQRERMVDTIPQHIGQVQVYQSERSQIIPQQVQEIEFYDIQNRDPNIPQQVQEIEYYDRPNIQNIPQHEIEIYGENGNQFSPQPTIGQTYGAHKNIEENYIQEENVEQDQMYQQYQQNGERFTTQENMEQTEEEANKEVEIQNNNVIDQPKEVYQEKDNQIGEGYEEKIENNLSQESVKQTTEENMENKKEIIEQNNIKQSNEYAQEEKVEITSQLNNQENLQDKIDNNNLNENNQQNEEMNKEENKECIHQENEQQNEQKKMDYTQNIQKNQEIYEEERKDYIPKQNIQDYQGNYEGEKEEYYNQQNNQQVQEYYQEERREYISQGDAQSNNYQQRRMDYIPSKYEERRRQFGPQEYTQISEQMHQEDESYYYPQQNIQQTQEMYQLESKGYMPNNKKITERYQLKQIGYIPQENIQQNEDYYGEERNYYQQFNNKENMNFNGNSFINQNSKNNGYITNSKYQSEQNRNMYSHKIYHTHEEMNGLLEDSNNYKFYESKNIKNTNEGDVNSVTLHHIRGDQKKGLSNNNGINSSSYLNNQQYQSFGSSNNSYYNYAGQSQYNSGFKPCPIHGIKNIKYGYSKNY